MRRSNPLVCVMLLLCLCFMQFCLNAQDTLILIDRKPFVVDWYEIKPDEIAYRRPGKTRTIAIERDKVFSIKSPAKLEQVVYVQDTLENNWLTAAQMRDYIKGQNDARKYYRRRANLTAAAGFLTGGIGAGAGLFYGPLFVIGYTGIAGFSKPSFSAKNGYDPSFADNEFYREGFGTMAKRMVTRRSAIAAAAGYVVGAVGLTLFLQ